MKKDMTVPCGDGLINLRAGAIILKDGKILMTGNGREPGYLYSVGGRIRFGETAEEAVVREVAEETGVRLEIDRLGFVHENYFFGDAEPHLGKLIYEVSFFFYMKVPEDFGPVCGSFAEDGHREYLRWVGPDAPVRIYPEFFREELKHPERGVKHFVTDERRGGPETVEKAPGGRQVRLEPMTREMYDRFFREYENDPDLYADPSRFVPYEYSAEAVERYVRRQKDLGRVSLAILWGDELAGEIVFKNIEAGRSAAMGVTLKNAAYKDRGIGTEAERLAVRYAFSVLGVPTLYADTLTTNGRSRRVLEKAGFRFVRQEGDFLNFRIDRDPGARDESEK